MATSGDASQFVEGSVAPGSMRIKPNVCDGMKELHPEYKNIDENNLADFLKAQGYEVTRDRLRSDLVYFDVRKGGEILKLRVAVLPTAPEAGRELHQAILEHGPGSWGVHRSNVAVLGPIGDTEQVVSFAARSKIACWGVLTMAGRDDSFVIPGGYTEI
jgi:hypothetical protein